MDLLAYIFRRGRDVVASLLSQIWSRAQQDPKIADAEQLALFKSLRDEGEPAHLNKFRLEVSLETQSNTWGYAFFIADEEIVRTSGIETGDGEMFYDYQAVASAWAQSSVPAKMASDEVGTAAAAAQGVDNVAGAEARHQADADTIGAMRREMAGYVKVLLQDEPVVLNYFNDALNGKFRDIPADDVFWQDENLGEHRSKYDFKLKTAIFPGQSKESVFCYLAGEKCYTPEQESTLIDLCIAEDKVHINLELAQLFLRNKGLSPESVSFADHHFYIPGKDKTFIPNDGNCFFHCLDYLTRQPPSSERDSAPPGPVMDLLA